MNKPPDDLDKRLLYNLASALIKEARESRATELDLSNLGLTELPESIWQLTQLWSLYLSNNQLTVLPELIGQLTQLRRLDLSNNLLNRLPNSIGQLSHLWELYLSSNQLMELPNSFGQITELQRIELAYNRLTVLPESIDRITSLQHLILAHNQLTTLPKPICQLKQLQHLDIAYNQLMALPESIGQMSQLRRLYFSHNQLAVVPESIGQMAQLRHLDFAYNQLTTLPKSISQLTQLQHFDLAYNHLIWLPESIGQLYELRQLYLNANQCTSLPKSIGQLSQLKELLFLGNPITILPECIDQLSELRQLYINANHLTALPESLQNMRSLEALYICENEVLDVPEKMLEKTSKNIFALAPPLLKRSQILEYYSHLKGGRRPLNEAKLILVGHGSVGKTSIVNRLIYDQFERDEKKTDGINITEWKLRLNVNEDVRLNIWDFGGQEIMHATHQFFFTQRSLYLLVLNGRESVEDADAEYWLKLIEGFGANSPVIVVLNKIKACHFDLNRYALQQKYPVIRDFIKTDCEDRTGIVELRKAIERETDRLEHLREAFPESWFTIKDQIVGMKKNYLTFDEYRAFCQQHNEPDHAAQDALADYLHNLGIVLNYREDPRLYDTHVLNPHWVTNGIYKILNSDKLEKQRGEIHLNELAEILDPTEYPPNMRCFIFDLMKKFDLCFSFPDDDSHYLIPELLDKQESTETVKFRPEVCLNFQYRYLVLPEGLLPRFIVRTHMLSESLYRWRTGVIMEFEGCRALVKADVHDKIVFISISGPASSRRRLLAVIRSDFERIHRDIRNLLPDEMVPLPEHSKVVVSYKKLLVMEQRGVLKFTEVVDDDVSELNVQDLLNGVDLEGTRRRERMNDDKRNTVRLFISYSHKDKNLRNDLQTHLKLLQRQGIIDTWDDRRIDAGEEWKKKIDENLERADIILLLVSADFMASDYCYEIEMKRALERHEKKEACVIPVIVRDMNWKGAPFAELLALPTDGLAISKWPDKDSAWRNVAEGIERVVEEIRKKSR